MIWWSLITTVIEYSSWKKIISKFNLLSSTPIKHKVVERLIAKPTTQNDKNKNYGRWSYKNQHFSYLLFTVFPYQKLNW